MSGGSVKHDLAGMRFGRLTVLDLPTVRKSGSTLWHCVCDCGAERLVRQWPLRTGRIVSCGCHRNEMSARWTTGPISYNHAHKRMYWTGGSASNYACVDCGGRAADWSYDNADPDELTHHDGRRFSASSEHYQPRCKKCHGAFDSDYRPTAHTCRNGHPRTDANTRVSAKGTRECVDCLRATWRRARLKRKARA